MRQGTQYNPECASECDAPEVPHRRYTVEIKIGADTWEDVKRSLDQIAFDLHGREDGAIDKTSGAPSAGYTVIGKQDPEMTHERYFADVEAWRAKRNGVSG